ncbi:hypothetical protein WICPIJ_008344 [Wickerhamomyces pijperi]|uniref:J domain-containing protein n=1 Tax=Wickerhamomyces pijperi TaxID=599730 RepID=A0A9P8TJ57_WICPI|nr:hypothetical protein WICPIJ_008344 [Wickerhamomyces pijperi]
MTKLLKIARFTRGFTPQSSNLLKFRQYATFADKSHFHHKEWPSSANPTPYQIFNMSPADFDSKALRSKYFEFAKIYHPDISHQRNHVDSKGKTLDNDLKNERFKLITEAYHLLKDPRKRTLYDQFKTGWKTKSPLDTFYTQNTQPVYATYQNYTNEAYWNASNWEDYENLRRAKDPEEMRRENFKALIMIGLIMVVGASIQGFYALSSVERTLLERQQAHDDCEFELDLAYLNYGLDPSRISRIKRFLWFRTFGLFIDDKYLLDQSCKENDLLMREVLGEEVD